MLLTRRLPNGDAQMLCGVFDALSIAVIVLDGQGGVVALSQCALRMIRRGTLVRLSGTRLVGAEPIRGEFEAAVSRCTTMRDRPVAIAVDGIDPRIATVRVAPLPRLRQRTGRGAAAIVVLEHRSPVTDPGLRPEWAALFTPAEASIARALLRGEAPSEIAQARGVTLATVRSQIRSVYAKAGATNRGEFMGKLYAGNSTSTTAAVRAI